MFKYKRLIYIVEDNISEQNKYRLLDILSAIILGAVQGIKKLNNGIKITEMN